MVKEPAKGSPLMEKSPLREKITLGEKRPAESSLDDYAKRVEAMDVRAEETYPL